MSIGTKRQGQARERLYLGHLPVRKKIRCPCPVWFRTLRPIYTLHPAGKERSQPATADVSYGKCRSVKQRWDQVLPLTGHKFTITFLG